MQMNRSRFTEMLIEANGMDAADFKGWVFHPGMLFGSPLKWWGDGGLRDFPHEGIDFCLFQVASGGLNRLGPEIRIPVLHGGVVRAVFCDYLGRTVLVEHGDGLAGGDRQVSFYAHTRPLDTIQPGVRLEQGDILATIADTRKSKAGILPHLHLTLGSASRDLEYPGFVWNHMRDPGRIRLRDPLEVVDRPYLIQGEGPIDPGGLNAP